MSSNNGSGSGVRVGSYAMRDLFLSGGGGEGEAGCRCTISILPPSMCPPGGRFFQGIDPPPGRIFQ